MKDDLRSDETDLIGAWVLRDGEVDGDENCLRIQFLVNERLERIGKDETGWETLFRDPKEGRYWERTYPNSSWHGGGPPALVNLSAERAMEKYPKLF